MSIKIKAVSAIKSETAFFRLNYNLTLYSSYFIFFIRIIFFFISESSSSLSQNILQREVGEDAGALAQHADELLRRVLHVRILQDVDAAIHLVVGSI